MPSFERDSCALSLDSELETASKADNSSTELRRARPEAPRLQRVPQLGPRFDTEIRQRLTTRILAHLPSGRLSLTITDNRQTMISVKRQPGPDYRVRIHQMFLQAPPSITRALARYIALNEKQSSNALSIYIDSQQHRIRRPRPRKQNAVSLRTRGAVHDLMALYDDLNQRYFEGKIEARITWGMRGQKRMRRSSIKMGSYSVEERLIRIHPSLDRDFVPRYFVEWIVYHEMLHQVHAIPIIGGRRRFHTPAFLAEEKQFEHYPIARSWERDNLDRLLNY